MKLFINECFQNFLKTAVDCCRTEQQIQREMHGALCTQQVSLNNVCTYCLRVIQKKQLST